MAHDPTLQTHADCESNLVSPWADATHDVVLYKVTYRLLFVSAL